MTRKNSPRLGYPLSLDASSKSGSICLLRSQSLNLVSSSVRPPATPRISLRCRLGFMPSGRLSRPHPLYRPFVTKSSFRKAAAAPGTDYTVSGSPEKRILYGGHQPTSPLQRVAIAGWSAVSALANPERGDMVAALGEVTGNLALERMYR